MPMVGLPMAGLSFAAGTGAGAWVLALGRADSPDGLALLDSEEEEAAAAGLPLAGLGMAAGVALEGGRRPEAEVMALTAMVGLEPVGLRGVGGLRARRGGASEAEEEGMEGCLEEAEDEDTGLVVEELSSWPP